MESRSVPEANISAEELLAHVLRKPKHLLYLEPKLSVNPSLARQFDFLLEKRSERYPLQYLLKTVPFRSTVLWVGEGCLIPRPETEFLVEVVLRELGSRLSAARLLDVGTGSGNVAIGLAKERPTWKIVATDISEKALSFAKVNSKQNAVDRQVYFIQTDLWQGIGEATFDAVVSNPPYLTHDELSTLQPEIAFEPSLAFDGGEDGLDFFRRMVENVSTVLKPDGEVFFEVGANQAPFVSEFFNRSGFESIRIFKDYNDIGRVITGRLSRRG